MIQLKRVGFWKPNSTAQVSGSSILIGEGIAEWAAALLRNAISADEAYPDVRTMVDPSWSDRERNAVLAHLRRGRKWMAYMGFSTCRICGRENGVCDMTDGVYVWPEGFAHYIVAHDVKPPEDFIRHVMRDRR